MKGDPLAELGTSLKVEPIGPLPRIYADPVPQQIDVAVKGGAGDAEVVLWLDGQVVPQTRAYGDAAAATVFANLDAPFEPGRHTIVAIATGYREAAAVAWAFTIR